MPYHNERNRLRVTGWLMFGKLCGTFIEKSFAKLKKLEVLRAKKKQDCEKSCFYILEAQHFILLLSSLFLFLSLLLLRELLLLLQQLLHLQLSHRPSYGYHLNDGSS